MSDLRKAAEMALEFVEWLCSDDHSVKPKNNALKTREALRQALAHEALDEMVAENQRLGLYDDAFTLDRGCYERGCVAYDERDGDGVNISAERVDKTAKGKHEPVAWLDSEGRFSYFKHLDSDEPLYTAPPKRDSSSWVGLTTSEVIECQEASIYDTYINIEAKLKEKNT